MCETYKVQERGGLVVQTPGLREEGAGGGGSGLLGLREEVLEGLESWV